MKKSFGVRKLIVSRPFITGILLLIQIGWFVLSILKLSDFSAEINVGLKILSLVMVVYLVCKEDCPSYKIAWIILILMAPIFGGLLYLFAGNKKPTKKMHKRITQSREMLIPMLDNAHDRGEALRSEVPRVSGTFEYIKGSSGYPICGCNEIRYYPFGEKMYPDMLRELEKAEKFIFIEYFIIAEGEVWDGIYEILERKAEQGVDVRIIYDDLGCVALLPANYCRKLEKAHSNIKCLAFNRIVPVLSLAMNNRDHRKMMIIDGKTAFSGGINLSDEYMNIVSPFGVWKDTGFMIRGEGVNSFTEMFLELWETFREPDTDEYIKSLFPEAPRSEQSGYIQPFYDTPLDNEALGGNIYIDILNSAERYVYIFTPYLILDDNMKSALCLAAKRGVDVRMVTPGIPDKKVIYRLTRANYRPLLEAGVRIFEYTPGFIHAKSFVSDDKVGVVGTINLDYRSLYLHFECGMIMYNCSAVKELYNDHKETMEQCREITLDNLGKYYRGNMFDALLRMLAPLL